MNTNMTGFGWFSKIFASLYFGRKSLSTGRVKALLCSGTGELGYDGPLYDGLLHMTDDMLGPSSMHIKYSSYMYTTYFVYDGPIFLVPLSPSYPSSPVVHSSNRLGF